MAPNANYDNISAITQELYMKKLVDNVFDSNALFQRWRKGNVDIQDGGTKIVQPLLYAKSTAVGWYSGADTFTTSSNVKRTAAEFEWKQSQASITITGIDEIKNNGTAAIIKHVEAEVKTAELTLADYLGTAIFNDGTTPKSLLGLRLMIAATGTYGGIAKGTYSWWQGNVSTETVLTLPLMQALHGDAKVDGDQPTVWVTTQDIFDDYANLLQPQQRFQDSKTADGGFENLLYKGKPIIVDSHCPDYHMFALNEKYISFVIAKSRNFRFDPFIKTVNQDASVAHIYFAGALVCSNPRMQAMFTSIA
jgi:hypothetical protein